MDPTEILETIRELVQDIRMESDDMDILADSLANRITQLDEYLCDDGELPEDWES